MKNATENTNAVSNQVATTTTALVCMRDIDRMRMYGDRIKACMAVCTIAGFVQYGTHAEEAAYILNDIKQVRALVDAHRAYVRTQVSKRVWAIYANALTCEARTSEANKQVANARIVSATTTTEEARAQFMAYINYNIKKTRVFDVTDARIAEIKQAAAAVEVIYNYKGVDMEAMLRAVIKSLPKAQTTTHTDDKRAPKKAGKNSKKKTKRVSAADKPTK